MPKEDKVAGSEGTPGVTAAEIVIELEGGEKKVLKSEDVKNLLAQQASVTQKAQKIAAIEDAAKKYGLEPEDYVGHAEGAFASVTKLMELGLIDEKGEPIERKEVTKPANVLVTPVSKTKDSSDDPVVKALEQINQRIKGIEEDQTRMMRISLGKDIRAKFDNLSDEDVSKVLGTAMNDPKKSVWQHAEDASNAKKVGEGELEKAFAKKYGINLEEWNANKIREQTADGGASALVAGKKISFRKPSKGGENVVTPKEAMKEFLRKQQG